MIGGFPHRQEDSFFHHTLRRLEHVAGCVLVPSIYTFGGFPVTRVPKHFKARCLDTHPDIVVLQFATSDLVVPVRHDGSGSRPANHQVTVAAPRLVDWCRWQAQGLVGDVRRLKSVTPLETYLETMVQIVDTLLAHQIVPVILSPFVFGAGRSDRLARVAAGRLQTLLTVLPGAVYVDAYSALAGRPRRDMLLKDGSHLSLAGQQVVADALVPGLETALHHWRKSGSGRVGTQAGNGVSGAVL